LTVAERVLQGWGLMRRGITPILAAALAASCSPQKSQSEARRAWVTEQSRQRPVDALCLALNGTRDMDFLDGWYPVEHDVEEARAWRWMARRAVVRLRLLAAAEPRSDMALTFHGWLPHEHLGLAAQRLTSVVNGHVLDELEPPSARFVHTFVVPERLIGMDRSIELAFVVANTVEPKGDDRELGFAMSELSWARARAAR
jgi:hypothetical protein